MKNFESKISFIDFQMTWLRCVSAMDKLVKENGCDSVTLLDISKAAELSEQTILSCFLSLDIFVQMYDNLIVFEQTIKLKLRDKYPQN
jgi:riboflavin synthase